MVYLYLHLPYKSTSHVGEYASPMDPIFFLGKGALFEGCQLDARDVTCISALLCHLLSHHVAGTWGCEKNTLNKDQNGGINHMENHGK